MIKQRDYEYKYTNEKGKQRTIKAKYQYNPYTEGDIKDINNIIKFINNSSYKLIDVKDVWKEYKTHMLSYPNIPYKLFKILYYILKQSNEENKETNEENKETNEENKETDDLICFL